MGFGFGWYTFAPVTITGAGHAMAGAVSFMHNVIRETCGIILIPVLAKKIGYIEVCDLPGVAGRRYRNESGGKIYQGRYYHIFLCYRYCREPFDSSAGISGNRRVMTEAAGKSPIR